MASIEKRRLKDGTVRYRALIRRPGFPSESRTFAKRRDAERWAKRKELDMDAVKYGNAHVAQSQTVCAMIDRYLETVLPAKSCSARYVETQRKQLLWWRRQLSGCALCNLSPYLLSDCKETLAGSGYSRRSPATVNRYLAALNHVLNTAVKSWGWLDANPLERVAKAKEPRGRVRFLSDAEREALLAAAAREQGKPMFLIILFAIATGARKSEILNLKKRDVDFERGVAVAYDTKNGDPRQLYLSQGLCGLLSDYLAHQLVRSPFVFAARTGGAMDISREWDRVRSRAGLHDFRFHDLRHTAASYLAMNGASPADIAEALGHRSYDMVKRYAHMHKTHVAKVVTAMSDKLLEGKDESKHAGD